MGDWRRYQDLVTGRRFRGWAFRGQRDATQPLETVIARLLRAYGVHPDAWSRQENRVNRIFRRKAHLYLRHVPDDDDDFQWLALMQHHGAPTRLLDFTWSPFVAAFFALERALRPAAVWALSVPRLWRAEVPHPDEPDRKLGLADLALGAPGRYERWYLPNRLAFAYQGEPLAMNQRLVAQSGTFVVPGVLDRSLEAILAGYAGPEPMLVKFTFDTARVRDDAMFALYSMNIGHATLFPGLDGMARSLAYELEHHWEYDPKTNEVLPEFRGEAGGVGETLESKAVEGAGARRPQSDPQGPR
ncbi:MAG: FRG domain-containing protein [Proteobacteria bacterium]|nr:MAG: FRG domain-containing protein [Pseudomonadota bacterium]